MLKYIWPKFETLKCTLCWEHCTINDFMVKVEIGPTSIF